MLDTGGMSKVIDLAFLGRSVVADLAPILIAESKTKCGWTRTSASSVTSDGTFPGDFGLLADDAAATFARLSREPDIDPTRIGFWGLSQGGWLAISAARKEQRAAFAIAVSGPMAAADVEMNFAASNVLRIQSRPAGAIEKAIAARTTVDE